MPEWKKIIFVNAIKTRVTKEGRSVEDIIRGYVKLTEQEKSEILDTLSSYGMV